MDDVYLLNSPFTFQSIKQLIQSLMLQVILMIPVPATTFFFQIWIHNYGPLATEIAWLLMGVE
jgi:hypothetical protein